MDPTTTRSLSLDGGPPARRGSATYLVVAMSCAAPLTRPLRICLDGLAGVELGRGSERRVVRSERDGGTVVRIDLPDSWMSSDHVRLSPIGLSWAIEDRGSKNGTFVAGQPCARALLSDGDVVTVGGSLLVFRRVSGEARADRDLSTEAAMAGPSTVAPELEALLAPVARVARAPLAIVIGGATGTGKEVLARAIHAASGRPGAFVALNCGGLAPTLVESELFGVKRGAFSGAAEDRPGLVRASDGGTLFLDEIGELPLPAQAALLRVLQEGEVLPVGGHRPLPVDLRVVAASHRDLAAMVEAGSFREDLLARLRGFQLALPTLAARREDIGLLVAELLLRLAGDQAAEVRFKPAAAQALFAHDWPQNVRELSQVLAAALAVADGDAISLEHLPAAMNAPAAQPMPRGRPSSAPPPAVQGPGRAGPLDSDRLRALFDEHGGNVSAVARALGTSRSQVRRLARRAGLLPAAGDESGEA